MTKIREKSKIFLWVCLFGFVLSLVGVMGSGGGGFLGGASLTSLFSTSLNSSLYVGQVGEKKITRSFFAREVSKQRNTSQFQINATESYYIGRAWEAIISNTIINNKVEQLNLLTYNKELKNYLINTPPNNLQSFLLDNQLFVANDSTFNIDSYQNALKNNIKWVPDSLMNIFANYESQLKSNDLPRSKLQSLYNKLYNVSNNEIKNEYINSKINCNIDVIEFDYNKISDEKITVTDEEIQIFYDNNKNELYTIPESIVVDYVLFKNIEDEDDSLEIILNEDLRIKAIDFSLDAQEESMGFETALATYELEIKDTLNITEEFNNNSGLPLSMGYSRNIIRYVFDNPIGSISDRISTNEGSIVIRILDKSDSKYKNLSDVSDDIKKELAESKKSDLAHNMLEEIINNKNEWEKFSDSDDFIKYSKNEESTIGGSFKTPGKNYKIMGALSVLKSGETSKIIGSNNKLYIIHLNSLDEFSLDDYQDSFSTIKDRLNKSSNNIFYNWIQYESNNIEKIDIRSKAI